ncbi:peptidylprolyl isomerase [Pseudorhodobacter sp.]|uniref:peptidylprolyl isomerase n=1 Tax=Pseudorhodobacter sp. TaxID=1934400 RepID=UPI002648660B|nr:peptidylprolyl isomerase [Pseudorhodobacter sp.]MDN5786301.1 peptidylprolyl isomerase [Pseudorhodobacter sp.]
MIRFAALLTALMVFLAAAPDAQAQNLFTPQVYINDRAITRFEVKERAQMLRLFRAPGDIEAEALKGLIEDRLRMDAAKALGIKATPEQIMAGMEEFASRANLSADQFVKALGQAGVAPQTFRDFVEAGLVWRDVVRQRFGPQVVISDAEIDRALAANGDIRAVRVLLSEIVLQVPAGQISTVMIRAKRLKAEIASEADFGKLARSSSSSASASRGGRLDWMPLSNLPAAIAPVVLALSPGQVSEPVNMGDTVGLFLLREIKEDKSAPGSVDVDYAQYTLPAKNGAADAAALRAKVDTCDDLYAINKGQPADRLLRETRPASQLPANIGRALADLDPGESVDFPSGGAHVFVMLCSRNPGAKTAPNRDAAREALINERLGALAQDYLEELRFNAFIREP